MPLFMPKEPPTSAAMTRIWLGLSLSMSAPLPTMGNRVHAPTAALLYQFREVAIRGFPTRVAHFDQPMFARS